MRMTGQRNERIVASPDTGDAPRGSPWLLRDGEIEVAKLVNAQLDWPWHEARLVPGPDFAKVRPFFDEEWRLAQLDGENETAQWMAAYQAIRNRLQLIDPDGRSVPEFLLHIDGTVAWWRHSNEPFPES